jgi:hypothetical protein
MQNRILILVIFSAMLLLLFGCENEGPLAPDFATDSDSFSKKKNHVPVGTVTPVASLPAGDSPEGIAVDRRGNMYISNTKGGLNGHTNEVLKVEPGGSYYVYASLPGSGHARGLVTDKKGNVYVAFATHDPNTNGVYKIKRNGSIERIEGSEDMIAPNALTFDKKGNLYATDSDGYAVWKLRKKGQFTKWLEHPLLVGGIVPGGPQFPLPGCNGIVFYPPNKLYVANTAQNSVSRILIDRRGNVASVELVKQDFLLMNIDGIAVDVHENIYGAMPASTLGALGVPPLPPLVMLNPNSGVITPIVDASAAAGNFNTPTSLAFGTGGKWNRKSVFMVNCAIQYGQPMDPWSDPGVVEVYVGIPGSPTK